MITDTHKYFKDIRDIEIHIQVKGKWNRFQIVSPKQEERIEQKLSWFGFFKEDVIYLHPNETHEEVKFKALKVCEKLQGKVQMTTKEINWIMNAKQTGGYFEYGNDIVIWTSWDGWHRELR